MPTHIILTCSEAAYEFNKMLEDYKGEKKTEEMETELHTECPVLVKGNHKTEAKFVTTYQNYKKTLHIKSKFEGTINIDITGKKKKNGKRFYKRLAEDAGRIFSQIKKEADSPLSKMIDVDEDLVVTYTSSATFCSSFGVDTHVVLNSYPLSSAQSPVATTSPAE
ncbi:hypothetical protein EB796_012640 [Bugula neritina]|uniref:Uncharacterized protein n=1 Tax=Bugula neritina TaxID=10212 RepID=A0A7J7JRT9_BUGNE|nr:hypothetical protein EB796_012640 [Bugula neritina]